MSRCTHWTNHPNAIRCNAEAEVLLLAPGHTREQARSIIGPTCRAHAEACVEEYCFKLGQEWRIEPLGELTDASQAPETEPAIYVPNRRPVRDAAGRERSIFDDEPIEPVPPGGAIRRYGLSEDGRVFMLMDDQPDSVGHFANLEDHREALGEVERLRAELRGRPLPGMRPGSSCATPSSSGTRWRMRWRRTFSGATTTPPPSLSRRLAKSDSTTLPAKG